MDHQRDTQQPGHKTAGTRDEPPHAEHQVRTPPAQYACRLGQGYRQFPGSRRYLEGALAAQALDANPLHREAALGHQSRLQPPAGTDPEDLVSLVPQPFGHRQGREDMAAGATGHDS